MWAPWNPSAAPSFADLFEEGCFGQRAMVGARRLKAAADARRLPLPLFPDRSVFEPLDRLDIFSPIGFRQSNFTAETTWLEPDRDHLVWREERNPEHWNLHAFDLPWGDQPALSECYSAWQLLYLPDALDLATYRLPPSNAFAQHLRVNPPPDWVEERVRGARSLDEEWRSTIKLLVALQSRFWPFRSNSATLFHDPDTKELIDPVERAVATFDPLALLRRFGLGLDGLARLHWAFVEAAGRLDPTPNLHGLLALSTRKQTDQLRGEALRARDLYDGAFMLRRLYHAATDDWLPATSDETHVQSVQQHRRRHLPRRKGGDPLRRRDLKPLLVQAGIYPHSLHIFVEGDTEEVVITRLLELLGDPPDVQLTNLHGVDEAKRYEALFRAASAYAGRTVLMADREGDIERVVTRFQTERLFTGTNDVLLWGTPDDPLSFEEANFSYGQLVGAMKTAARTRGGTLTMRADDLRAAFDSRLAKARAAGTPRPALANTAIGLAREPQHGNVALTKGDLTAQLAGILERAVRRAGSLPDAAGRYPVLERLRIWLATVR